jgi:tRNA pseudouridine38-40 synthase
MKYFAKIKYLGTEFHGFQVQPNLRTVQGELCRALDCAFGVPCKVTGCSRTDAGVHANEFCVTIENEGGTIPPEKLPIAVSRFLPTDLSLFYARYCPDNFHPRYDVISKEYLYKISNARIYDPFLYGRVMCFPRVLNDEDVERMRKAADYIIGRYDFSAFMSEGSDVTDTVRTVYSLDIKKNGESIDIYISADGFLYNMVRIIVGTLLEVGVSRFSPEYVKELVESKNRNLAGMTAPPEGLYLNKVIYPDF